MGGKAYQQCVTVRPGKQPFWAVVIRNFGAANWTAAGRQRQLLMESLMYAPARQSSVKKTAFRGIFIFQAKVEVVSSCDKTRPVTFVTQQD